MSPFSSCEARAEPRAASLEICHSHMRGVTELHDFCLPPDFAVFRPFAACKFVAGIVLFGI